MVEVRNGNLNDKAHLPPSGESERRQVECLVSLLFQFLDIVQLPRLIKEWSLWLIESKDQKELLARNSGQPVRFGLSNIRGRVGSLCLCAR